MGWGDPEAQAWPGDDAPAWWREPRYDGQDAWATPQPPRRIWLHLLLFALTLVTTMAVGARFQRNFANGRPAFDERSDLNPFGPLVKHPAAILEGIPFAVTLLFILSMHEWGHMLACRRYGIAASYPYFIPAPTIIGTMGAFIRIRSPFRSKRDLFDVGIWGPIFGFITTLPFLVAGLAMSRYAPGICTDGAFSFGHPPLMQLLNRVLNPGVAEFDLSLHPVALAAWVGLFATSLNLLPAGQLDGGHILYAVSYRWHGPVSRFVGIVLGLPMLVMLASWGLAHWYPAANSVGDWIDEFYWPGWFFWSLIILTLARRHPPIYDFRPLDSGRQWLAVAALAIFLLCFAPIPFRVF